MSSETKHTPGPWIAHGGGKRRRAVSKAGGGFCICQMTRNGDDAANARLIAAAPELLDACRALLYCVCGTQTQDFGEQCAQQNTAIELVRAAIAKATGGAK